MKAKEPELRIDGAMDLGPLACPLCGSQKVRPIRVRCSPVGGVGGEIVLDRKGVHIDKDADESSAGPMLVIEMTCEKHHFFAEVLCQTAVGFHRAGLVSFVRNVSTGLWKR